MELSAHQFQSRFGDLKCRFTTLLSFSNWQPQNTGMLMSCARGQAAWHTSGQRGCCEAADLCFDSVVSADRHLLQDRMCPFLLIYGAGEVGLICFRVGSGHESSIMAGDLETAAKRELLSSRTVINPERSHRTDMVKKKEPIDWLYFRK